MPKKWPNPPLKHNMKPQVKQKGALRSHLAESWKMGYVNHYHCPIYIKGEDGQPVHMHMFFNVFLILQFILLLLFFLFNHIIYLIRTVSYLMSRATASATDL